MPDLSIPARAPTWTVPDCPVRIPWRVVGVSLVVSLVAASLLLVVTAPLVGAYGLLLAALAFLGAAAALTWQLAIVPFRAARARTITVDEGGVRCGMGDGHMYWPFVLLGPATIEGGLLFLSPDEITLRSTSGAVVFRMPVLRESVWSIAAMFAVSGAVRAIEERRAAEAPPVPPVAAVVARLGRALPAWRSALDALVARDEAGYRSTAVDFEALLDVAVDARHDAELRAGAVYTLLAGAPEEIRAAAQAVLGEGSPPLVLLMARLSAGGAALGIDAALQACAPYLEDEHAAVLGVLPPG